MHAALHVRTCVSAGTPFVCTPRVSRCARACTSDTGTEGAAGRVLVTDPPAPAPTCPVTPCGRGPVPERDVDPRAPGAELASILGRGRSGDLRRRVRVQSFTAHLQRRARLPRPRGEVPSSEPGLARATVGGSGKEAEATKDNSSLLRSAVSTQKFY